MSRFGIGAALVLASSGVWAAADPAATLVDISAAARKANYEGVIVYQTQDRLDTLRVVHGVKNGVEMERVQALNGAPREVLKQNGKVICLLPKSRRLTLDRPTPKGLFPPLSAEQVAQLAAVYTFRAIGTARVADRACNGLEIMPRDRFRYGYQIWADQQTGVPLKVNLVAPGGHLLEQMMFTEVKFPDSIPDSEFQMAGADAETPDVEPAGTVDSPTPQAPAAPVTADASTWQFSQLPPGFRVMMRDVRPNPDGNGVIEHLLLSDGLSAISVFRAHRVASDNAFQGRSRVGAVHAFGRLIGHVQITVVGEAPSQTVQMIGESVEPDVPAAASGTVH